MTEPLRYSICGLGRRATTTYLPVFFDNDVGNNHILVAVVDADPAQFAALPNGGSHQIKTYHASEFERMLFEVAPDRVIIASPDYAHGGQILSALRANVSVLTEKPLTHTSSEADEIVTAAAKSSASVGVAQNLRFLNLAMYIKQIIVEGALGQVEKVTFRYHLTSGHGSSYFRRWHRSRAASGGLSVTKSCHHFDLINWWLDDLPQTVSGWQEQRFFKPDTLIGNPCGARIPKDADIEDIIAAHLVYSRGAFVSYTLLACSTWEGFELRIEGTNCSLTATYDKLARLEHTVHIRSRCGSNITVGIPREPGRHCGADARMISKVFQPGDATGYPSLQVLASVRDGAAAVKIGEAIFNSTQQMSPVTMEALP